MALPGRVADTEGNVRAAKEVHLAVLEQALVAVKAVGHTARWVDIPAVVHTVTVADTAVDLRTDSVHLHMQME